MDMPVILGQMGMLFILIAVGYLAGKFNVLPVEADKILSRLVLFITLPAKILGSVMRGEVAITGGDAVFFILMTLLAFTISHVIAILGARLLGGNKQDQGMYGYIAAYGNFGFMGLPVTYAIFGATATLYIALTNLPFTLIIFSVGLILISGQRRKFNFKILLNPALLAIYISLIIFLTGFNTPTVIANATHMVGSITSPAAMLVIGLTLSRIPVKDVFLDWRLYPMAALRLIVIPIITWLILRQIITDDLMLGVLVVISAMPTAAVGAMIAVEYGGNDRLASSGVFLTTLLSGVTVPLIVFLLLT